MGHLTVQCSSLPQRMRGCVNSFSIFLEELREKVCHFFKLHFCHYSYVHQGSQEGCIGLVLQDRVQRICNTLNAHRPKGVFFNAMAIENQLHGGVCSSMAFDFVHQYLHTRTQSFSSPYQVVKEISHRYRNASMEFMLNQSAFNTIETNRQEPTVDFRKDKIAAMLKLYGRNVGHCSEEMDLSSQRSDRQISQIMAQLHKGIFLMRSLQPAQNQREEVQGHSTVFVNEEKGMFFYDPNYGTMELQKNHAARIMHDLLQQAHRHFNIPHLRFYQVL